MFYFYLLVDENEYVALRDAIVFEMPNLISLMQLNY